VKTIATVVSGVFHPLLFPTYGAFMLIAANPHIFGLLGSKASLLWLMVVFILTFLFPTIWLLMMKKLDLVQSLKLETATERIIPYIATCSFYLWAFMMFKPGHTNTLFSSSLISLMLLGAAISGFVGFFANIFTKISIHTIGAGSMLGLVLAILRFSYYDLRILFVIIIIMAGLIGTSRLILKAHDTKQVYLGYLAGFTGQFLAFSIIPLLFKI
jgi:hypothetical protein